MKQAITLIISVIFIGCEATPPFTDRKPVIDPKIWADVENSNGLEHLNKGEYDKALGKFQESLALRLKYLAPNHPDVAQSYNNIGYVYGTKAEYDKALEYFRKSLAINLKQPGADHPSVANNYNNMALIYEAKKNLPKAKEYWEKAYAILIKKHGPDYPHTKSVKAKLDALKE